MIQRKHWLAVLSFVIGSIQGYSQVGSSNSPITLPLNATIVFSGMSPQSGESCTVTLRTRADGTMAYLSMNGAFSGKAFANPTGLEPSTHGYEGSVEFFKGLRSGEITLESHVFRPGFTLFWNSGEMPPHTKEMGFFGASLETMNRIVFKEQSLLMNLKGECLDLHVTVENRHES